MVLFYLNFIFKLICDGKLVLFCMLVVLIFVCILLLEVECFVVLVVSNWDYVDDLM